MLNKGSFLDIFCWILSFSFQSGSGLNECEQVLAAHGGVCCLCIDSVNGAYVAGVQQFIRYVVE